MDSFESRKNKGGRSKKSKKGRNREELETSDIDDDVSSYISNGNLSYQYNFDRDSVGDGSQTGESGIEESDDLEQKLETSMEAAVLKNTIVRSRHLKMIEEMFTTKIMGEILFRRKAEMLEVLIKSFKIGKGSERCNTSHLTVLYALQCGEEIPLEDLYDEIYQSLVSTVNNSTTDITLRARAIFRLATLCFLCSDNIDDRKELFVLLREKLSQSNPDIVINTLSSLSLILTICSPTEQRNMIRILLPKVRELLKHANVDVRIEAGEFIAHIFEMGRGFDEEFDESVEDFDCLVISLTTLSTDSAKFRAKRDRKVQRASFREILAVVNGEGEVREEVKVSLQETLTLETWSDKVRYGAMKEILGPSTSLHLQQNTFIREIFGLGPPPLKIEKRGKVEKHEIKKLNAACQKARQKNMLKQRDKRMVL